MTPHSPCTRPDILTALTGNVNTALSLSDLLETHMMAGLSSQAQRNLDPHQAVKKQRTQPGEGAVAMRSQGKRQHFKMVGGLNGSVSKNLDLEPLPNFPRKEFPKQEITSRNQLRIPDDTMDISSDAQTDIQLRIQKQWVLLSRPVPAGTDGRSDPNVVESTANTGVINICSSNVGLGSKNIASSVVSIENLLH